MGPYPGPLIMYFTKDSFALNNDQPISKELNLKVFISRTEQYPNSSNSFIIQDFTHSENKVFKIQIFPESGQPKFMNT